MPPAVFCGAFCARGPGQRRAPPWATCLDTALLVAASLEAAGLSPAVFFTERHAFAGVWLVKRTFGTAEIWDVTDLRKAIVAREFVPFETTLLTGGRRGTASGYTGSARSPDSPLR